MVDVPVRLELPAALVTASLGLPCLHIVVGAEGNHSLSHLGEHFFIYDVRKFFHLFAELVSPKPN